MVSLPPIGSAAEREPLLMKRNVTKAGAPWEPGLTTVAMRTHLQALRAAAVALIQQRAASEPSLERVAQLEALVRQVAMVSPHQLRHGLAYRLWKTATPAAIMQILGHSRVATTLKYGKPTEDDLRTALEAAGWIRYGEGGSTSPVLLVWGYSESDSYFPSCACERHPRQRHGQQGLRRISPGEGAGRRVAGQGAL
jgi:hypothetical protein